MPLPTKISPTIGPRLRHIRLEKGFTVEMLAAAAGLNKGFLSRLERGAKRPSVATVLRLAAALDVPVGQLFGEQTTDETVRVSRATGRSRSVEEPGAYSFELLTPKGRVIEAFLFHIGAEPSGKGQQHDGEEMFLVLSGTVEMRTPDRSYVLEAGDCAYFPGHLPHQMRRIGSEAASAVIAVARERSSARKNQTTDDVPDSSATGRNLRQSLATNARRAGPRAREPAESS
jgi:transcriptional regulator with XRE-family HTH domain